ncbi:MAG: hypothetical protein QF707_05410 [Candidatus Poseidoniaceae archaeon]|jgi:thiol-disulfide isomerase/thioredoxin|nr:hypothetical protein [Candidatus Poseidoniaceae archaeon]MDP7203107.1 hypothetical protein [Candidatus Poseidoniaceae archaeon]
MHSRTVSAILLTLLLFIPSTQVLGKEEEDDGNVLLLEELTATWCVFCAQIDPQIVELQEVHAQRLITVTIHPPPGDVSDPLFNEAMRLRYQYLGIEATRTPSFWLNGDFYGEGVVDVGELSSQVMAEEARSTSNSKMSMSSLTDGDSVTISLQVLETDGNRNDTRVTIMMVENIVELRKGLASNGQTIFNNVLLNSISIELDDEESEPELGGIGWTINKNIHSPNGVEIELECNQTMDDDVFFIAIHESINESTTFGVVDTMATAQGVDEESGLWVWAIVASFAFGIIIVIPNKK